MRSSKSCSLPKKDCSLQCTFECFVYFCYSISNDGASSTSFQGLFISWIYFKSRNLFSLCDAWHDRLLVSSYYFYLSTSNSKELFPSAPILFQHNSAEEIAFYPTLGQTPHLKLFPFLYSHCLKLSHGNCPLPPCPCASILSVRFGHWTFHHLQLLFPCLSH